MRSRAELSLLFAAVVAWGVPGCGGGASEQPQETTVAQDDAPRRHRSDDGVAITGIMGTISADEVHQTMDLRQDRFLDCFSRRLDRIEVLAGDIQLAFRIGLDGHVLWVYPKSSTIGDRDTEACILQVAASAHFHPPQGGEAEFGYPLSFDAAGDVRQPVTWAPDRVDAVLAAHTRTAATCGMSGQAHVTMYVAPGGRVLAAGGSVDSHEEIAQLDCVLAAVRGWTLPTPGSYTAKVSFDVD